jgi:hypothetical protein
LLERDSLIHRVDFPTFHDAFGLHLGKDRDKRESERDRGSDSAVSGTGMRSYDTRLGPSFDMPDSVNGHSRTPDLVHPIPGGGAERRASRCRRT